MIGVVACSKSKRDHAARACDLYTGRQFRASAALLRAMGARRLVILSAKWGAVDEAATLEPYSESLVGAPQARRDAWARTARAQLATLAGAEPLVAIVPADYAGALEGFNATRLFVGYPQGKLYSATRRALEVLELGASLRCKCSHKGAGEAEPLPLFRRLK